MNCLTNAYSPLWTRLFDAKWSKDYFVAASDSTVDLAIADDQWSRLTPLRTDYDRWLALCEMDALAALLLGLSENQLIQMYRSAFDRLRKYEYAMVFDGRGHQVSGIHHAYGFQQAQWEATLKASPARRGERSDGMWDRVRTYLDGDTSIDLGPFVSPFRPADRETAMGVAYRAFAERVEVGA
jgi:hypothetical protein